MKKDFKNLFINEVTFSESSLLKVVKLYSKIMGKQLSGEFKILGLEEYTRSTGPGKGFRVMNNAGEMLRFNWDSKLAKESSYDLTSIDYWKKGNVDFEKPTRTIMFSPELNVVQVLGKITSALESGNLKESAEITEARSKAERQDWVKSKGIAVSNANSEEYMIKAAEKAGLGEEVRIFLGQKESNTFEESLQKIEKEFDGKVYADPETVFDDIEDLLSLVASGKWRTLIVCGQGGIGKTFHITNGPRSLKALLGSEGDKWTYHSGTKAAPFSFYKTLFQERDKVIVFDEADSLLKNPDIVMMLKPILDTSGDNMAEYMSGTYNTVGMSIEEIEEYSKQCDEEIADGGIIGTGKGDVKIPSKFQFTGGMIFISNMRANQIEGAIMSRSIFVDVYLAEQDILKRIKSIMLAQAKNDPDTTPEDVEDILEALGMKSNAPEVPVTYMTPEYARKTKQITVRAAALANTMRKAGLARWAELASLYA